MSPTPECSKPRTNPTAGRRFGVAGVVAALTCTLACCLPAALVALGVGASAAAGAGHAAHGGARGWWAGPLEVLHRLSPALLIAAIVLVAAALGMRRRAAVLPAAAAGVVLYLSVHGQTDPILMYAGMAVGYAVWTGLYLWTRPRQEACRRS